MSIAREVKEVPKTTKKPVKDLRYMYERDRELVRGIFRFYEVPGGTLSFPYRKYLWDETTTYTVVDGEIYTIPRGVAHHLSNNCAYPEHSFKQDDTGRNIAMISKMKRRCSFDPLDFMDVADLAELTPSNLETVTLLK